MPLCPPQAVYPGLYCRVWSPGFQHTRNSGSLGSDISYQPDSHNHTVSEGFGAQTRSWKECCTEVWFLFNIVFWQWAVRFILLKESNVRQQHRYSKMSDFKACSARNLPLLRLFMVLSHLYLLNIFRDVSTLGLQTPVEFMWSWVASAHYTLCSKTE